ncbi:hypothetical protein [Novosphingobium sp.]|nr:hypothetical protein [Novosphingobium sp.]
MLFVVKMAYIRARLADCKGGINLISPRFFAMPDLKFEARRRPYSGF